MTPDDLKQLYEKETGKTWNADDGVTWLNKQHINNDLNLYARKTMLDKEIHITLSDKASWLSQQHCHICHPTFPISIMSVRIRPESWQSLNSINKVAFKAAIYHRLSTSNIQKGRICLSFLFVCSTSRKTKDLDNMAKLLMDSIKGVVMEDDKNVDHLNLMRLTHEGEEEYVTFRISASHINDHSDVVHSQLRHSWAGAEPLDIEDFKID